MDLKKENYQNVKGQKHEMSKSFDEFEIEKVTDKNHMEIGLCNPFPGPCPPNCTLPPCGPSCFPR